MSNPSTDTPKAEAMSDEYIPNDAEIKRFRGWFETEEYKNLNHKELCRMLFATVAAKDATIADFDAEIKRLRDLPLCRVQLPDGTVPENTEDALVRWHDYGVNAHTRIAALTESLAKARDAMKPILAEAKQRADYMHDTYNPDAHIEMTLTVAEIRAIQSAKEPTP